MIDDVFGRPMTSAHAIRGDRRYLYYVSRPQEDQLEAPWRLPAGDLDALVTGSVLALLRDPLRLASELGASAASSGLAGAGARLAERLDKPSSMRTALQQLDASVVVSRDSVHVTLNARALADLLGAGGARISADQRSSWCSRPASSVGGMSFASSTPRPTRTRPCATTGSSSSSPADTLPMTGCWLDRASRAPPSAAISSVSPACGSSRPTSSPPLSMAGSRSS